ncbi:MAG: hypothetical protein Kow0027_29360 [Saprospiraceae bacterium]
MNTDKKPFLDSKLIESASLKLRACNHRFRLAILNTLNNEGPVDLPFLVEELNLNQTYVVEQLQFLIDAGLVFAFADGNFELDKEKIDAINASLRVFATE